MGGCPGSHAVPVRASLQARAAAVGGLCEPPRAEYSLRKACNSVDPPRPVFTTTTGSPARSFDITLAMACVARTIHRRSTLTARVPYGVLFPKQRHCVRPYRVCGASARDSRRPIRGLSARVAAAPAQPPFPPLPRWCAHWRLFAMYTPVWERWLFRALGF